MKAKIVPGALVTTPVHPRGLVRHPILSSISPPSSAAKIVGQLQVGDLCLVLEVRSNLFGDYVRISGPGGTGWVNADKLQVLSEPR